MPPGLTALELETDRALLQQIYDQYEPRMYRVALQVLKSSALAEDAVHDAFLKLIKHFSEIRKISCKELEPFVVIIVKRTALDLLKQEKRLTSLEDGWDPPAGSGPETETAYHRLVELIRSMPEALARTELVCSSVNVGSTRAGINMDAVALMGRIVKDTAAATADRDGLGCAKLVVFCNAVEDNPFMAGAFHGVGEAEKVINVGVSGPGVVCTALKAVKGQPFDVVAETVKKTAFRVTRMGQLVAQEASRRLDTPFGIVDLSLAPTPAIGDSVARILEEMGLEVCGTHGTTAALALLNDAVKKGGVMASSSVGGLSGAFIPVSEDEGMIAAAEAGTLCLDKLEAMTCVCSVGLDMIAVPGDTPAETISAIIADEAAIGMVNNKTTAVRLLPAPGKTVGDRIEMGGLLGSAPVMPVHPESSADFIARGGRIPAPLHSLKN